MRLRTLHSLAVCWLIGVCGSFAAPPNILFILVDDLAWSDLGCYGHAWHQTPNIDRLAGQGVRFTQAYSPAPICSAARASILTGKSVARVGLEFVVKNEPGPQVIEPSPALTAPPINAGLQLSETTIAEHLSAAGYQTAYFGKWHLNSHHRRYLGWSPTHGPGKQGFQFAKEDFGSHPYNRKKPKPIHEAGRFLSDGITEKAKGFLKRDHDRPFFLMVSHFYVHTPIRSPYEWLKAKYRRLIPNDAPLRKERIEYAAFLETLDHHMGELLDALTETGLESDTLVVFLSDNGGHPEYVANAPLRGSKWNLYEGGIRVPMIARWPGRLPSGVISRVLVIGYDLFPTFAAVAGQPPNFPGTIDGRNILPLIDEPKGTAGRPLYWHFPYYHPEGAKFGRAKTAIGVDDFAVSQTRPHSAIRKGRYKLIHFAEDDRIELYDVLRDPSERVNLATRKQSLVSDLKATLLKHLDEVEARRAK